MMLDPGAKLFEHGGTLLLAPRSSLLGRLAQHDGHLLDEEELRDDAQTFERQQSATASRGDQASPRMRPATSTLAAGARDDARDVGAVALDGASWELRLRAEQAGSAVVAPVLPVEE